jgi:MFS family permease
LIRSVPAPVRLLSIGVLINNAGGYVSVFLALILAVRHTPAWRIGLALLLAALFAIGGSALGGAGVSRIGARLTIIGSMAGSAFFTALLIAARSYPLTVALVCCVTACNRAYAPAAATVIGRVSQPAERVQRYAFFQFAYNIGAAIGPPMATFLLTRSLTALFLIDAITSAAFALAALRLPPGIGPAPPVEPPPGPAKPTRLRHDRRYLTFCLGVTCVATCYSQQSGALPLTIRSHHYNLELLGIFFSANAIAVIVLQLPVSHLIGRLPYAVPLIGGGLLICGGYAILLASSVLPLLIVSVALWTFGEITFNPVTPAVAMMMSTAPAHGAYQGALSTFRTTGQVAGPALGVFAFSIWPPLPWAMCGVLAVAAAALFVTFSKDRQ